MQTKLNIQRLIDDLGGAASAAKLAGVVRTAPYGWVARQYVSSVVLERIKSNKPDLELDSYFEEDDDVKDETGCGS